MKYIETIFEIPEIQKIISEKGRINIDIDDFSVINTVFENGEVVIMAGAESKGEGRVEKAISTIVTPQFQSLINSAKNNVTYLRYSENHPLHIDELDALHTLLCMFNSECSVIWGIGTDNSLGENVKVVIVMGGISNEDAEKVKDEKGVNVYRKKVI